MAVCWVGLMQGSGQAGTQVCVCVYVSVSARVCVSVSV